MSALGGVHHLPPYPVIALVAGLLALVALYRFFIRLRRDRLVADTPAVRIRSAAQGYVKVRGKALPAGPQPTPAPLTARESHSGCERGVGKFGERTIY